jgi:ribosomal protein S18 acetylase RimI-like enzyme
MEPSAAIVAPYDDRRLDEVAAMLARAFVDDPLYRWFFPNDRSRLRKVGAFVTAEVRIASVAGRVDLAVDSAGRLLGAALWGLPGRYPFPTGIAGRAMARAMPRMGVRAARRLPKMLRVEKAHPPDAHYYLTTLGVDPSAQRRGVGTTLVNATATLADSEGVPIYLETFNPDNPEYYRRLGFTDREHIESGDLPPFWTMLRAVGGAGAASS